MTHVIVDLCIRDGACVDVCPVECIVKGEPEAEWPWFYIDPDTCIDCGACVPECPVEAIFPEDDVPVEYSAATAINRHSSADSLLTGLCAQRPVSLPARRGRGRPGPSSDQAHGLYRASLCLVIARNACIRRVPLSAWARWFGTAGACSSSNAAGHLRSILGRCLAA